MSDTPQITLRDSLEASFNAAEDGSLQKVEVAPEIESTPAPEPTQASTESTDKARDEKGRFAPKAAEDKASAPAETAVTAPAAAPEAAAPPAAEEPPMPRPRTWKKEYMPTWEKIAKGEAPTPEEAKKLAQYVVQRESEFTTGVATYRAEAQNAKHLTDALAPFMPTIQRQGLSQAQFVNELGRTYHFLLNGAPQEKMQALAGLARNVGIPLEAIVQQQGNQLDPVVPQLMQYIQQLEGKVNNVTSWRDQEEQRAVNNEIAKFNDQEKYPHFETVRQTMGQLLQNGMAQDTEAAYQKAVRMHDDVWQAEQARQAQLSAPQQTMQPQIDRAAEAAQARAKVISPRTAAPTGTPKAVNPKDIRSMLDTAFDAHVGGRV